MECYFVFDRTSYRTGLDVLKNTQPYEGVSLNFCALQLDGGPIKTSTICFDNSGIDPNHPYVIAKVGPSFNLGISLSFCACLDGTRVWPLSALRTASKTPIAPDFHGRPASCLQSSWGCTSSARLQSLGQALWCWPIAAPVAIFIPKLTLSMVGKLPSLSGRLSQVCGADVYDRRLLQWRASLKPTACDCRWRLLGRSTICLLCFSGQVSMMHCPTRHKTTR